MFKVYFRADGRALDPVPARRFDHIQIQAEVQLSMPVTAFEADVLRKAILDRLAANPIDTVLPNGCMFTITFHVE